MRELPILMNGAMVPQAESARHSEGTAATGQLCRSVGITLVLESTRAALGQGLKVGVLKQVRPPIVNPPHAAPVVAVTRNRHGQCGNPESAYRKGQRHA